MGQGLVDVANEQIRHSRSMPILVKGKRKKMLKKKRDFDSRASIDVGSVCRSTGGVREAWDAGVDGCGEGER